jgi:hypothetical protein
MSLERTDEDMLVGCRLARLIPSKSCCLSSLQNIENKQGTITVNLQSVINRQKIPSVNNNKTSISKLFFSSNLKDI